MGRQITLISGDGIGPGVAMEWDVAKAGVSAFAETGQVLPGLPSRFTGAIIRRLKG
jgi:hypothetical protein